MTKKFDELAQLENWSRTDRLAIDDNDVAATKHIELRDVVARAYGGLNLTASDTMAVSSTPAKYTLWNTDDTSHNTTPTNGDSEITIDTPVYALVLFDAVGSVNDAGNELKFHLRKNGAEVTGAFTEQTSASSGAKFNYSFARPISLVATDVLSIYVEYSAGAGKTYTAYTASLQVIPLDATS